MKLAWLCYEYDFDLSASTYKDPVILFHEPERYRYDKVIPIVYAEIVE
jgi:hypothetical protein